MAQQNKKLENIWIYKWVCFNREWMGCVRCDAYKIYANLAPKKGWKNGSIYFLMERDFLSFFFFSSLFVY